MSSITNVTTGQVVAVRATMADTYWKRFRGLMLRRRFGSGEALVIRPCGSIHMMFMLFPIDVVFHDESMRVTTVSRRVLPWVGLAFGGRAAKGVIELPSGGAVGVEAGHQLSVAA